MIRIWHDSAMRWMPLWLSITMLNTSVLLGFVLWRQATLGDGLQPPTARLLIIPWLAVAFYFVFGNVRTRCLEIEMTLPIPSRTLWRRHLAAVFLAGGLILAASLGVLLAHATLITRVDQRSLLEIPFASLVGPLLGGLLLAAAVVGSLEPGLWKLTGRRSYWFAVLGSLIGIPALLVALVSWPWISTGICVALAIAIVARAQRLLPGTYRLAPTAVADAPRVVDSTASTDRKIGRLGVYRTLFHLLHTAPPWKQFTPWMVYFFVALMGFVLAGGLERWKEIEDLRFLYLPFGSYMLFAGIGVITYNLYRIDALPVSRRTILMVMTLPGLFFYCSGYALGWWSRASVEQPWQLVDFRIQTATVEIDLHEGPGAKPTETRKMVWVDVESSFMGMSLSGEVPTLTSPWGESHPAWSEELFRGASPVMFNPYNTSEDASTEFEALMLSRAIEDIYGRTISPDELQERYFVVRDGELVNLRAIHELGTIYDTPIEERRQINPFPLLVDYPDLKAPRSGPETPVYLAIVLIPWLLLTAWFLGSLKATHSLRYVRWVYWLGLAIPMLAMLASAFLSIFDIFSAEAGRGFLAIFIRSLGVSPLAHLVTWIACLAAISAAFWLALRRFERAEIPTSPINCSLVDWGKID